MKKQFTELIGVCCTLVLLLIGTTGAEAQYCIPGTSSVGSEWLAGVEFAGIDNQTPTAPASSYTDFTGITGVVAPGVTYEFVGTIGNSATWTETMAVWIDFNQDEIFDNVTERFNLPGSCNSNGCELTTDILIPLDATPGITRMRVRQNYFSQVLDACATASFSETEDYSLLVGGDCTPPDFAYTITDDCELFTYDVTATLNGFGEDLSGPNTFITIYLTRSDIGDAGFITIPDFLIGQTVDVISDVPFGVTVSASVVGNDPTCDSNRNWSEVGLCPPANNECDIATELFCGDDPISGSTVNASGYPEGTDICGLFSSPSGAVWYEWTAPYNAIMSTNVSYGSTFFDYQVVVLDGTCGDFECLGGVELGQVTWDATEGHTYYLMVFGWGTAIGDFTIGLNCTEVPCDFPGLTAMAVDGDGVEITDEDCVDINDTYRISVTLDGGDGNDSFTVTAGDSVKTMVAGETHIFGLYSPANTTNVTVVGDDEPLCDASASVSVAICPPSNDDCETAQAIECGVPIYGTTISATPYPVGTPICGLFNGTGGAVWYEFTAPYNASVTVDANYETFFDYQIAVLDGTCGDFECLGGTELGTVTWNATIGETYYIMVFGWGTATGSFELSLDCDQIYCEFPILTTVSVDENGDEIEDCLEVGSTYDLMVTLEGGEGNSSWSVNAGGTGAVTMVAGESSTFGPFTVGSTVSVVAIGADDTDCNTTVNTSHTICPPANDECETAQELICGTTIAGTTIGASNAPDNINFNTCGGNMPGPSYTAWYTFTTETANEISVVESNASGINGTFYDLEFFVYTGECGGEYTCVAGQNFGNTISFTSEPETTYYVLVSGYAGSVGTFNLSLSCVDVECQPSVTATAVDSEGNAIEGCVDQQGEYYVLVDLEGGDNNDEYNVYLNGADAVVVEAEGSVIVGPVAASAVANISVTGVTQVSCSNTASTSVTLCPPSNDSPCAAIAIPNDGSSSTFSNVFATADAGEVAPPALGCNTPLGWCNSTVSNSVWFTFVAPESGRATVSLCGSASVGFDTQVAVYSVEDCADYSTYTLAAANDDAGVNCSFSGVRAVTAGCFTPGETYYVQVDSYSSFTQNSFEISVTEEDGGICSCVLPDLVPNLPPYEVFTFANTQPICDDLDNPVFSLTFYAPEDLGSQDGMVYTYDWADNPGEPITITITETYVAPELFPLGTTVNITVTISDEACEEADGSIYPLSGGVIQDAFACDPDCEGTPGGTVGPGSACEIDGLPGSYDVNCDCIPVPVNDLCSNAIALECGADPILGSNESSTSATHCNGGVYPTVWYSFTAEQAGSIFLTTCNEGTNFDSDISMFTGSCEDGTLTCFSGWGGGGYIDGSSACTYQSWASEGTFDAEAGVTYYIAVTGYFGGIGDFAISASCTFPDAGTINGTVDWLEACGDTDVTLDLYAPDSEDLIGSYDGVVDLDGNFTIAELPVGTYDVIAKVDGALAVGFADYVIAGGDNALDLGAVMKGDTNGDNKINIIDVSNITAAFNSSEGDANFNPLADLNCSGGVNIADISIFTPNFGESGAEAPLD